MFKLSFKMSAINLLDYNYKVYSDEIYSLEYLISDWYDEKLASGDYSVTIYIWETWSKEQLDGLLLW